MSDPKSPAFIHSQLDDYGLTPSEFRVYCHISRRAGERGEFYESIPHCAEVCKMNAKTVRSALASLVKSGLIRITSKVHGFTAHYRVTRLKEWNPSQNRSTPHTVLGRPTPPKMSRQRISHEVTPIKVIQEESTFGKAPIPLVAPKEDDVISFSDQHDLTCTNAFLRSYENRWHTVRNWQSAMLAFEKVFLQSIER